MVVILFAVLVACSPLIYRRYANSDQTFFKYPVGVYILFSVVAFASCIVLAYGYYPYLEERNIFLGLSFIKILFPFSISMSVLVVTALMDMKSGQFSLCPLLVSLFCEVLVAFPKNNTVITIVRQIANKKDLQSPVPATFTILFFVVIIALGLIRAYSIGDMFLFIMSIVSLYRIDFDVAFLFGLVEIFSAIFFSVLVNSVRGLMCFIQKKKMDKRLPFTIYILIGYVITIVLMSHRLIA